jgi:hypothetical protein
MRRIEITIDPAGAVKIEAVEFRGPDCEKSTRFLEAALGLARDRRRKPEFHIQAAGRLNPQVRV